MNKTTEPIYAYCVEDLQLKQVVVTPSGRKAKVIKLRQAGTAHHATGQKDIFERVSLEYLDEDTNAVGIDYGTSRVTLQPHLLRIV